jgi:CheY-like chemotaxis protein
MATVLIAEDGSANRASMRTILTGMGHQINGAATAKEAITQIDTCFPDLIICDLDMRDGDGLDVVACAGMERRVSRIPILLLTETDAHASLRHRILEKGLNVDDITAVFSRPIDPQIFASSVTTLLKTARKVSSAAQSAYDVEITTVPESSAA